MKINEYKFREVIKVYTFLIFDYRDIGVIKTLKHRLSSLVFNYIFGVKTQRNIYSLV